MAAVSASNVFQTDFLHFYAERRVLLLSLFIHRHPPARKKGETSCEGEGEPNKVVPGAISENTGD